MQPLPNVRGAFEANLKLSRHGPHAPEPHTVYHHLIEDGGDDSTMDDVAKALKLLCRKKTGTHFYIPHELEVQLKSSNVLFAADKTMLIIDEFHTPLLPREQLSR